MSSRTYPRWRTANFFGSKYHKNQALHVKAAKVITEYFKSSVTCIKFLIVNALYITSIKYFCLGALAFAIFKLGVFL